MVRLTFYFMVITVLLSSCKKDTIVPGNYQPNQPPTADTSNWRNTYTNGGGVPTSTVSSGLIGTTWVLTHLQIGFNTTLPIDTIKFIDNTNYKINGGSNRTYQLSSGIGSNSKTLTLNSHFPFGSGNYSGEVASTFISDGVMNNVEFKNTQTTSSTVRAWFTKI